MFGRAVADKELEHAKTALVYDSMTVASATTAKHDRDQQGRRRFQWVCVEILTESGQNVEGLTVHGIIAIRDQKGRGRMSIMAAQNRELAGKLKRVLWPDESLRPVNMWAVLDAAKDRRIFDLVSRSYLEKCCLFAGELSPELERAAPHLVEMSPRDSVTDSLLEFGWGQAWGIFLQSDDPIRTLRRHLRTFLRVKDEAGHYLLFRYYDPRVLRAYLPTCRAGELKMVFGSSIIRFCTESEDPASVLSFELDSDNRLKQEVLKT